MWYPGVMRQMNASRFKEQCLSLLDQVGPEGILITKRGRPVARLVPASSACADLIGSLRGKIKIRGDILSTGLKWRAQS